MMKEKEEKEEREEKEKEEEGGCKYSGGRTPALNQRPSVTGHRASNAPTLGLSNVSSSPAWS